MGTLQDCVLGKGQAIAIAKVVRPAGCGADGGMRTRVSSSISIEVTWLQDTGDSKFVSILLLVHAPSWH